jgi:hypothetical protein
MKNNTKAVITAMPLVFIHYCYGWYLTYSSKINEASDKFAFAWIFFVLLIILINQQYVFDSKDK